MELEGEERKASLGVKGEGRGRCVEALMFACLDRPKSRSAGLDAIGRSAEEVQGAGETQGVKECEASREGVMAGVRGSALRGQCTINPCQWRG